MSKSKYVRFFDEFGIEDVPSVGGKNASLGEMYQKLSTQGVRVPNGFAITADAYRYLLEGSGAVAALHEALDGLVASDVKDLARRAKRAREIVLGAEIPDDLAAEILVAYRRLSNEYGEDVSGARRPPKTCRPPVSPVNKRPSSMFMAKRVCLTHVSAASRACSRIARFTTVSTRGSITTRSPCRSVS